MAKSERWREAQAAGAKMREARTNYAKVECAMRWSKEVPEVLDSEVPVQRVAKALIAKGLDESKSIATLMRIITLAREVVDDTERMLDHSFIEQEVELRRLLKILNDFTPRPERTGLLLEINGKLSGAVDLTLRDKDDYPTLFDH